MTDTAADRARRERAEQGLPPTIEDEATLRKIARVLATAPSPADTDEAAS